jgi:hypothetical protein
MKKIKTAAEIAKETSKLNKRFMKSSTEQKKVIIAKDVIAQLNTRKYIAENGTYMLVEKAINLKPGKDIKSIINQKKVECKVCAIGAVFASCIRINNKMDSKHHSSSLGLTDTNMVNRLSGIFSEYELALMEFAFEGFHHRNVYLSDEDVDKAKKFTKRVLREVKYNDEDDVDAKDSEALLRAIMENIITNKGIFKP